MGEGERSNRQCESPQQSCKPKLKQRGHRVDNHLGAKDFLTRSEMKGASLRPQACPCKLKTTLHWPALTSRTEKPHPLSLSRGPANLLANTEERGEQASWLGVRSKQFSRQRRKTKKAGKKAQGGKQSRLLWQLRCLEGCLQGWLEMRLGNTHNLELQAEESGQAAGPQSNGEWAPPGSSAR